MIDGRSLLGREIEAGMRFRRLAGRVGDGVLAFLVDPESGLSAETLAAAAAGNGL